MANFDLNQINLLHFDSTDMPDFSAQLHIGSSFRLSADDECKMPEETKNIEDLRIKLSELFGEKFESYAQLEAKCDIKRDTFQRVLKFKNGKSVTYQLLSKFCVGAGLTIQTAVELFALMGHNLSSQNRCDYILLCELKNRCNISEYDNDMQKYGYILANPFKRFEDMQMMRHTKTLEVIEVDDAVWKKLSMEEKEEISQICDKKLSDYYEHLTV